MRVHIIWANGEETWMEDCTTVCPPGVACMAWVFFKRTGQRNVSPGLIHEVITEYTPTEQGTADLYKGKERG